MAKVKKKVATATKKDSKKAVKKPAKKIAKTVKKAVKKTIKIVKTSRPKKKARIDVTVSKEVIGEAPIEYHFVLNDGNKLKSIQDLAASLEDMGEEVFRHHVNDFKNDFATWVEDIFKEENLGKEIRKARSRIETRIKVLQKIVDDVVKEGRKAVK